MLSPIEVVEAAYRLDGTDLEWLRGIGKAIRPLLDGDRGLLGYLIDTAAAPADRFVRRVVFDVSTDDADFVEQLMSQTTALAASFHDVPHSLDASTGSADNHREAYRRLGVADFVSFRTVEPGTQSVAFVAGQRVPRSYDRAVTELWARVAAHIAAGRRLRAMIATDIEAVVSTVGRIEHAIGEAATRAGRDALRDAVGRQEFARANRTDERGIAGWTPLIGGRWSLIDHFDRSGRRFLVARPNEHGLAEPRTLTPRERSLAHLAGLGKSNEAVAYELGIAETTVETHLIGVMKKLGASTRIELMRRLLELA